MDGFERELAVVMDAVRNAGRILLDRYGEPQQVKKKGDGTPVTDLDHLVSRLLGESLERHFPGDGVVDEERPSDGSRSGKRRCWFIDPLDGTKEYIDQTGDFGILVGLLEGDRPVFGVTYKPCRDELAYAARGQGAYMVQEGGSRRLQVSSSDGVYVVMSRSRTGDSSLMGDLRPDSVVLMGGSLKTVEVAKGDATLFLCPKGQRMSLWDICAPSVILEEAGGKMTDGYGKTFDYRALDTTLYQGIIASNGRIHQAVLERTRHHFLPILPY